MGKWSDRSRPSVAVFYLLLVVFGIGCGTDCRSGPGVATPGASCGCMEIPELRCDEFPCGKFSRGGPSAQALEAMADGRREAGSRGGPFCGWVKGTLVDGWRELTQRDEGHWHWQPGWLVAAGLIYLAGLLPFALFWFRVLRVLGQRPTLRETLRAYYIGHLGKYVPGKAMVVVMRTALIRSDRWQPAWRRSVCLWKRSR